MQMGCAPIAFYVVNTHAARYANHVGGKLRATMLSQTCLVANNALRNGADQSVEKEHIQKRHQRSEGRSHCQKRKKHVNPLMLERRFLLHYYAMKSQHWYEAFHIHGRSLGVGAPRSVHACAAC